MRIYPSDIPNRIAVIGGGIAGAAAAAALRRRLGVTVTILEQEIRDGRHASGLNAGMIRQVVRSGPLSALAIETARVFAERAARDSAFPFRRSGSVLLAGPARAEELREAARRAEASLEDAGPIPGARPDDLVLRTPGDGLIAPRPLLDRFLDDARAAGVDIRRGHAARVETAAGRVTGVVTDAGSISADLVIVAAGAWTAPIVSESGGQEIPLIRRRRHLVPCRVVAAPADDAPFVWHLDDRIYVRPWRLEDGSRGLLACPGDDEDCAEPCARAALGAGEERLREALPRFHPADGAPELESAWAGIRTFSPDGTFVVGPDALREGLFWLAGLGGHGVSSSWALGRLVADLVAGHEDPIAEALSPRRFSTRPAEQGMNG